MMQKVWMDLSRKVFSGMPVYPGDPLVRMETLHTVPKDQFHMEILSTSMHAGTHLDAPKHFLGDGSDICAIPLEKTGGLANLIRILPQGGIILTKDVREAFSKLRSPQPRLILSTGWEFQWGSPEYFSKFPGFEPDFGNFLREKEIVLLGLDLPSVKYGTSDQRAAHRDFLGSQIVIVESMVHLDQLPETFLLIAFPLKIAGMDGSLVRAAACLPENLIP